MTFANYSHNFVLLDSEKSLSGYCTLYIHNYVHIPHRQWQRQSHSRTDRMASPPEAGTVYLRALCRNGGSKSGLDASHCPQHECTQYTVSTNERYESSGNVHTCYQLCMHMHACVSIGWNLSAILVDTCELM